MRRMVEGVLAALLLLTTAATAGVLEPRDSLLRWLDAEVVPELGERLSRHPDFRHAIIDFMPVADGAPSADASQLHTALQQHIRQRLLGFDGVQLHLDTTQTSCTPPRALDYAIGIEVTRGSGREARITIALLDLQRRVWVSGVSSSWRGQLTHAQARAHEQLMRRGSPGSAAAPFPLGDASALAALLLEQVRCVLPRGVDGAVYFETPDDPGATRVALELRRQLMLTPLFVLSERESDAEWRLRIRMDAAATEAAELGIELVERASSTRQRLASVFIDPRGESTMAPSGVSARRQDVAQSASSLLSPLTVTAVERTGICRNSPDNVCAEVRFGLEDASHLLVFSTRSEVTSLTQCDASGLLRERGEHRFRLQIIRPDSLHRPATGFYVLAIRNRDAALDLHRIVASAPGACGIAADADRGGWLARLEAALRRHGDAVQWRAIHLDEEARPL